MLPIPPGLVALPRLDTEAGFRTRSRFHYTEMLAVAPTTPGTWLLDRVGPSAWRRRT